MLRLAKPVLAAALLLTTPTLACETVDDLKTGLRGTAARVTVISEAGELSRALSFMIGHADEVQTADALVVIEQPTSAEVVLVQRGCATLKAVSERHLITELLRRAKGSRGELI